MKKQLILFCSLLLLLCNISRAQIVRANLENDAVRRFLSEVSYNSSEDESQVIEYYVSTTGRLDWPTPVVVNVPASLDKYIQEGSLVMAYSLNSDFSNVINSVKVDKRRINIYNLVPNETYYYCFVRNSTIVGVGKILTRGQLRMIYAPSVLNVRDIGGWPTADGRRVRYGKLYRGGELNGLHVADNADLTALKQLGIAAEIDLRANYEEEHGVSAFGFVPESATPLGQVPSYLYTADSGQLLEQMSQYKYLYRWKLEFQFIVKNLRIGRAVYYHCRHGADRTGYLSLLLEGLLGVDYDSLIKDFELTTFARSTRTKDIIDPTIEYIESLDGNTLQQKFRTFWIRKVGISESDVNYFISAMLDGDDPIISSIDAAESMDNGGNPDTGYYDMQGRRISEGQLRRGIYITNGRKIVVR